MHAENIYDLYSNNLLMRSFIEHFSDEFYNNSDDSNRHVIFPVVKTIINNLRARNINSIIPLKFVTIKVKIVDR